MENIGGHLLFVLVMIGACTVIYLIFKGLDS